MSIVSFGKTGQAVHRRSLVNANKLITAHYFLDEALSAIESDLTTLVKRLTEPLFAIFDFFQLADPVYEDIVDKFVWGQVT